MPLHGKIVVVKRSGVDGTEFPLTATCLFGRKPDCDIRIQLPQVSKEHCRIDLNENKEVILTNLSSVNPTRVNGEALQQSERLKHGDVITIIDRSFRFEYPPPPTPKKRSSIRGKTETFKVLQDQQVGDTGTTETGEKRISEVSTDPHLKDGTNHDNIQRSLDKTVEVESKEENSSLQNKTTSPFNDLYQMIKKSLDVRTPQRSSTSLLQTPCSRFCTPKPVSVRKTGGNAVISTGADETKHAAENTINVTPKSAKKQRRSFQVPSTEMTKPEPQIVAKSKATSPQKRNRVSPQRFTVCEVIEQVSVPTTKSPVRRRSKEATPVKQEQQTGKRASPRNSEKVEVKASKKRKSGDLATKLPTPQMKRKRVSFGGHLSPELFDKRLPPNSPLRKGATPRRSLCLLKPKQSLLRRASVIGLIQENASPKTPTPGKKSPKSRSSSPKTASPAKKSPKPKSPSPKAATPGKKSPKPTTPSPKAATPGKTTPKSKSPSPASGKSPSRNKVETPKANEQPTRVQTPTVQGRFSVSRISTPSPTAEDSVTDPMPLVTVTPKLPLRRKSTSRKTPGVAKNAVELMRRRSGISRASMKGKSFAEIVKFGQAKVQVAAPAKKPVTNKTVKKKVVPKPQTPARQIKGHVSTGHANSPATIVLSRARQQMVVCPTGAAPRLVTNTALLKNVNMKMDEDLTGISEMYKTPLNERKRSVISESCAMKTPVGSLGTSVVEPSVLNTPEEPGEMMVSPLSVSAVQDRKFNSEAVQRLLNGDQESSIITDVSILETHSDDCSEQQSTDLPTASVTTPKQKSEPQECLTGVKRIMKTPRQKAEPVEDLRGRLLKTPKQKPEQQECLTGVKRIMKTPRQKAEPVEDLRGKILKTPKQKPEPQECFSGVKAIFKTPQQRAEPLEDVQRKLLETPNALGADDVSLDGANDSQEAPACVRESGDLKSEMTDMKTPNRESSPLVCLTGIKRIMKTPREKSAPVEDMVGVKRLMKTPKEKMEPVEEHFGIKRLVKSPRLRGIAPVEDFEGLQELMEEPVTDSTGQEQETNEVEDQTSPDCGVDVAKELDFAHEEPRHDVPSEAIDNVPQVDTNKDTDANEVVDDHVVEEMPCGHKTEETSESLSQATIDDNLPVEEPRMETADDNLLEEKPKEDTAEETVSEEEPKVETAPAQVLEIDETTADPDHEKTSAQSRLANMEESHLVEDEQKTTEHSEDPVVPAPARGRRGKKTDAAAPPAVRQTTRGRNAKTAEGRDVELTMEKSASPSANFALKPKRGRNAKKASDQGKMAQEVVSETVPEPEREQSPTEDVDHEAKENAAPLEKAALKPKRGRRAKQPEQAVPHAQSDDVPQADSSKETDADGVCSDQLEVLPNESEENKSSDAVETVPQEPATESLPEVETAVVQKKSVRGRRATVVETKSAEEKQEATGHSEDPAVPATVRGRRGRKTEAAAPPAVRQTRGKNSKSQESTSDDRLETVPEKAVETLVTEAVSEQTSPLNTSQENESTPPAEEAVIKPVRGRKTKQKPVEPPQPEPEKGETVSDEHLKAEAQPQTFIPAVEKPRRGRKTKPDTAEQSEVAEDSTVAVETKQQPAVRAKRGRNAKQEEEKQEDNTISAETTSKSQGPVKKLRRTRNVEQDHVEPKEEVQNVDVVPEQAEITPVAEPVKINEQDTVAAKPRRGGRKAKQDTESETPVESNEVKEVSAVHHTDKLKRGRRGKQVTEEAEVTAVVPEEQPDHELKTEEKSDAEPDAPSNKRSRTRGVKPEVSQASTAKRARRGAAPPPEETRAESTSLVSQAATTSAEPVKRGRRAAAKPTTDVSTVTSDQANPTEESRKQRTVPLRSVTWKADVEVLNIPKETPIKAVRGRKSKLSDQVDAENKKVSKDVNKTEEKDLSDKVVKVPPVKRARRGAKVADVTTNEEETTSMEAETKPKTRRGRSAK